MQQNDRRILGNVVLFEGWIAKFTATGVATVHLDCVFRSVPLGGGQGDEISLRLALRRAEVYLRTMEGDSYAIVTGSQWSEAPTSVKVQTATQKRQRNAKKMTVKGTLASFGIGGNASASYSEGNTRIEKQTQFAHLVQHLPDARNGLGPGFEVTSKMEDGVLDGHAWHKKQALLKIKRLSDKAEQAQMQVTVRCRYPDLAIDPLPLEEKARRTFFGKKKKDERLVAAEQYLKEELTKLGFLTRADDLDGHFEFTIGTLTISEGQI
jgi:hypothetical protein